MKKRVLSMLLCLVLCCGLLPVTVLAVEYVSEVYATLDELPVIGEHPNTNVVKGATGNYNILTPAVWWELDGEGINSNAVRQLTGDDIFKADKWYRLDFRAAAVSGYQFEQSTNAYLNGVMCSVRTGGGELNTLNANGIVQIEIRYACRAKAPATDSASQSAAEKVIGSVSASVTAPTVGKTPSDAAPTITSADATLYSYDWFADGSAMSKWTEAFEGGKTYTLKIRASTTSAFTSGTTATINGSPATVQSWDEHSILFYQDFAIAAAPAALSAVGITATAPEAGKSPTFSATLNPNTLTISNRQMGSSEYTENGVGWLDQTTGKYLKPSDTFQAGHSYQFSIGWLRPASGSKLAADGSGNVTATATVNGQSATISGSSTYFIVNYTFLSLAAAKSLASIAITKAPTKTEYTVGNSFDATGMVVTATYSDNSTAPVTGYTVTPNQLSANTTSVTISYTQGDVTKTATQAVKVDNSTIGSVALTLAAPKAGEKASFAASVPSDADYTVKSVDWFCDEDNASLKNGDAYGKKTYILNVTLSPKSGYKFADETVLKGTLNGESAQARRLDDGSALVTKYFSLGNPNPFTDVKEGDYFYDAVQWAYYVEPQVTNGVGNNEFGPDSTVTRGQAMTFLWRAAGCPEPKTTKNPFTDVKESDYWYKAILWAAETGVSNGTGDNKYSPNMHCSRAHIVTFLYRAAGEPNKTGTGAWYDDAANWANSIGLLSGTAKAFTPEADCPRKDIVLYLYRQLAK